MKRYAGLVVFLAGFALSKPASAHCDTTKGPVVMAARAALDAGDPDLVLHWVRPEDEAAVRSAFQQTLEVRALGPVARALADRYFFETLVRIHRAGEGAPYTGLSDADPDPIIVATDRALARGSADELEQRLVAAVSAGLAERFAAARATKDFRPGDVAAGRAFVSAYVALTHWVEGVFTVASEEDEHEGPAAAPGAGHAAVDETPGGVLTTETSGRRGRQYLPWMLTGLLGIAALTEGALLLRRRHHAIG
jgi:hypothetical protein